MAPPNMITPSALEAILSKMRDPDMDLRLMALIDLQKDVQTGNKNILDDNSESTLIQETLRMVEDGNGEVKNMAVNTLSTLISRVKKPSQVTSVITNLLKSTGSKDEQQRDIADTALKKVLTALPLSSPVVPEVVEKVSGSVLKQIQVPDIHVQHAVEMIDILSLIFNRFPTQIFARAQLQTNALDALLSLLSSPRQHIRKRCIHALASLAPLLTDGNFAKLSESLLAVLGDPGEDAKEMDVNTIHSTSELTKRTSYASLVGSLVKNCPVRISKGLDGLIPSILNLTEELEHEDALEAGMTTLETIVLRCPTEVTPFLSQIAARAAVLLKHDPNYATGDGEDVDEPANDGDEDMVQSNSDDDEDEFDEEFDQADSDEEDSSWKARRSAAKLIYALISSRTESLPAWYKVFAPLLTSRLSEREESVRVEIFADWEELLRQTLTATGTSLMTDGEAPSSLKRKRQESNGSQASAISRDSPLAPELPALVSAVLKQCIHKSPITKEKSFTLLRLVVDCRGGGLEQHSAQVASAVQKAFDQVNNGQAGGATSTSLIATVLAFLGTYFEHQPAKVYIDTLAAFIPEMVKSMSDKHVKISTQAFSTASQLARGLRPELSAGIVPPLPPKVRPSVESIYVATAAIIEGNAADATVRNAALLTLGDLLVHEGDLLQGQQEQALRLISERLDHDVTRAAALEVVGDVAGSILCSGSAFDGWLAAVVGDVPTLLRRSHGADRVAVIKSLQRVLKRTGQKLPLASATSLLAELSQCLGQDREDAATFPSVLLVIAEIIKLQPKSCSVVEKETMPAILAHVTVGSSVEGPAAERVAQGAPTLSAGSALDAFLLLLETYGRISDQDAGIRLVAQLFGKVPTSGRLPVSSSAAMSAYPAVAKAVGVLMSQNNKIFAYFAPEFRLPFEKKPVLEGQIYLTLLTIGEIGRTIDQHRQADDWEKLFDLVTNVLEYPVEQIKSAAAFALGNIAVGNVPLFLPRMVSGITSPRTPALGLLYLHALKEAIEHCSADQIESIADTLWVPLLGTEAEEQDDGTRNVRAACIGRLATANPSLYLPQLHNRISSPSITTRATIAAAIRYTLVDSSAPDNDLLSSLLLDFLLLMEDQDYNVRRLAVSSLNAAASNKPEVIQAHLPALLPALYKETVRRPELLREFLMGPFKVIQDDGINNRKAAYETMLTLLKTSLNQLDRNTMLDRVLDGLLDEDEVKVLCCVLLQRLFDVAPLSVLARSDVVVDRMKPVMEPLTVTKDTVAQDIQRKEELQKAAYRAIAPIFRTSSSSGPSKLNDWVASNVSKWKDLAA